MAETSYAKCGDLSLAYQVFGPVDLVFVSGPVSQVEVFWALPEYKAFFEQLATFCRVVRFDKPGSGCRTRSRTFGRWMIERPRSRPSWTRPASDKPSSSV
jgi:pimeloyl-ACP methyl ester carboxylesterase